MGHSFQNRLIGEYMEVAVQGFKNLAVTYWDFNSLNLNYGIA